MDISKEIEMLPAIRARWDAMILTRELRRSHENSKERWKIDGDGEGDTSLTKGEFKIELVRRTTRLLDAIYLYQGDAEVWLPLVSRIRLRAAARVRLLESATKDLEKRPARSRAPGGRNGRPRKARAS